jgi:hypothetical protein
MHRLDLINKLILKNNYKTYLEIGVSDGHTFDKILATNKIGVDPDCDVYKISWNGKGDVRCLTSDSFFEELDKDIKFDIIFIDGLHLSDQVFRDIKNSLLHLNENGIIVVHDCSPSQKENATTYNNYGIWNGTVYIGYIEASLTYKLDYSTVNTDFGCGLIRYKNIDLNSEKVNISDDWNYFNDNRESLLNLISVNEFENIYLK